MLFSVGLVVVAVVVVFEVDGDAVVTTLAGYVGGGGSSLAPWQEDWSSRSRYCCPATFLYHHALLLGLAVVVFRRQK